MPEACFLSCFFNYYTIILTPAASDINDNYIQIIEVSGRRYRWRAIVKLASLHNIVEILINSICQYLL